MNIEDDGTELSLDTPLVEDEAEAAAPEGEDGDIHIEIEGEEAADETELVKHLRGVARDAQREAAELRKAQQPQAVEIGKKPDLWDDCEGDPDKFETALLAYNDRVRQVQQAEQSRTQATQTQAQQFERARANYTAKALQLGIKDPDAVVSKVAAALSAEHAGFIMQYARDPATLMAALDAHPALLAKIADEPDPMRQLVALVEMQGKIKMTRKGPPPPEAATIQRGSASLSATADKHLAALEKKAGPNGDRSEIIAYKRSLKDKAKA